MTDNPDPEEGTDGTEYIYNYIMRHGSLRLLPEKFTPRKNI